MSRKKHSFDDLGSRSSTDDLISVDKVWENLSVIFLRFVLIIRGLNSGAENNEIEAHHKGVRQLIARKEIYRNFFLASQHLQNEISFDAIDSAYLTNS